VSLIILEVDDATEIAGELFHAAFAEPVPRFPRHFVAFARAADASLRAAAYLHYTAWEDIGWLCGGLCVARDAYRRADAAEAAGWKRAGGIGEMLLRHTFARLDDRAAILGYCGDARQWQHDLNAGFEPAGPAHLLVKWTRLLPVSERARIIERAAALGPF
jgi:hypothetical protein